MSAHYKFIVLPIIILSALTFACAFGNGLLTGAPPAWLSVATLAIVAYALIATIFNEVRDAARVSNGNELALTIIYVLALIWNMTVLIRTYTSIIHLLHPNTGF